MSQDLVDAILERDVGAVALALREGADPSGPGPDGSLPLYLAAVAGKTEIVQLLLEAGADPNADGWVESDGTPLCAAACWGYAATVRELLVGGADPDLAEAEGMTPLLWAARGGHAETARALLEAGADPNGGHEWRTPLWLAADFGSDAVVALLLEYGARPDAAMLAAAEAWAARDVEAELRRGAQQRTATLTRPRGGRLEVGGEQPGGGGIISQRETGHAKIAALLRSAIGG